MSLTIGFSRICQVATFLMNCLFFLSSFFFTRKNCGISWHLPHHYSLNSHILFFMISVLSCVQRSHPSCTAGFSALSDYGCVRRRREIAGLKGSAGMKFHDLIVLTSHTEFVYVCVHAKASVNFIPCNDREQARNAWPCSVAFWESTHPSLLLL